MASRTCYHGSTGFFYSFLPWARISLENALSLEKLEGVRRQTIARPRDECSQFTRHWVLWQQHLLCRLLSASTWTLSPTSPPPASFLLDLRLLFPARSVLSLLSWAEAVEEHRRAPENFSTLELEVLRHMEQEEAPSPGVTGAWEGCDLR